MNGIKYWSIALLVIAACGIVTYAYFSSHTWKGEYPNATMTVEGQFDRIELKDAHYGNYNGEWVIDELVAVATTNGTVSIANTHYEGSYIRDTTNFFFVLEVRDGITRYNDTLDVMGGDIETYYYPNLTVTISLEKDVVTEAYDPLMSGVMALTAMLIPIMISWMCRPNQDDRY
jgi:hypothetical protein